MNNRKEYQKAWREAHKDYQKAWKEAHKDYMKAWKESHKEQVKTSLQSWRASHKEQYRESQKAWRASHKEQCRDYDKAWKASHKKQYRDYQNADLNSLGQTKNSIRTKSNRYLSKYAQKIDGYEIHHCCTYDEPYKFIYCSKDMHRLIHSYLRQHNIDADSDHYQFIKHLLDDTVIKFNVE